MQAITIAGALRWGSDRLGDGESPATDCRVLLCHVLKCDRSYLFTWPEKTLTGDQQSEFETLVHKRREGYPVAYLIGRRGFWDLTLKVNPTTLIPRPETELLVETALELTLPAIAHVCDLGTGTGAIALALASERPGWSVTGVDRINGALALAAENARLNGGLVIDWRLSHWFSELDNEQTFDLIVSNPPYVEDDSEYLSQGDVRFEPKSALTAGADGLDDIREIVEQAPDFLKNNGWLVIEHGYTQHPKIATIMQKRGFTQCRAVTDLNGHQRITLGQWQKS